MKVNLFIATFSYGNTEFPSVREYLTRTARTILRDPRVGDVHEADYQDTPIPMLRNRAMYEARAVGADYLLMIDSDMAPDIKGPPWPPFWDSAFEFVLNHRHKPCLVAAPYCGPPPEELPYVFHWKNRQSGNPNPDLYLQMFTREEAAARGGFEEVAALPTGLMLLDMRVMSTLKDPFFYYEYADDGLPCMHCGLRKPGPRTHKASTEDVTFTRDLSVAGIPVYCAWDSWAGHWKQKCVGPPVPLTIDAVRKVYHDAVLRNQDSREQMVIVGAGKELPNPARGQPPTPNGLTFLPGVTKAAEESADKMKKLIETDKAVAEFTDQYESKMLANAMDEFDRNLAEKIKQGPPKGMPPALQPEEAARIVAAAEKKAADDMFDESEKIDPAKSPFCPS